MQTPYAPPVHDFDKPHSSMPASALFVPANVLAKSRGWLLLVAICLLLIALLTATHWVVLIENELIYEGTAPIAMVGPAVLFVALLVAIAILILRYRYQISRTLREPSEHHFVLALNRFTLIWKTIGIAMLIFAMLVGIAFAGLIVLRLAGIFARPLP
jgi:hypothetical protein